MDGNGVLVQLRGVAPCNSCEGINFISAAGRETGNGNSWVSA